MRARFLFAAAALALAAPVPVEAADLSGYYPVGPNCSGLQPTDVYVPPQVAYIVACTVALPSPPVVAVEVAPAKHGHWSKPHGHHSPSANPVVAEAGWYGPHATHDASRYEGKLVYLKGHQQVLFERPPVHFLVVPK